MVNEKVRELYVELSEEVGEEIFFLDNQAYDNSIIGYTEDYRLIYSYSKMIEELAQEYIDADPELAQNKDETVREEFVNQCYIDARNWIDYNTLRALPYFGDRAPIIIYEISRTDYEGDFDE